MRQWGGSFRLQLGVIGALSKQSSALALSEFHNGVGPEDLTITRRLYGKLRIDGSIDTHCNITCRFNLFNETHENHPLNFPNIPKPVFTRRKETKPASALATTKVLRFLLSIPDSFKPDT
jgi:hypothetical protein